MKYETISELLARAAAMLSDLDNYNVRQRVHLTRDLQAAADELQGPCSRACQVAEDLLNGQEQLATVRGPKRLAAIVTMIMRCHDAHLRGTSVHQPERSETRNGKRIVDSGLDEFLDGKTEWHPYNDRAGDRVEPGVRNSDSEQFAVVGDEFC